MSGPPAKGPYDPDRIRERVVTPPEPVEARDLTAREQALAAGPDAFESFIRECVGRNPGGYTEDFRFLLDRLALLRADTARVPEGLRETALRVVKEAEPDEGFEGEYIDYLVPHQAIEALSAALSTSPERSEDETDA